MPENNNRVYVWDDSVQALTKSAGGVTEVEARVIKRSSERQSKSDRSSKIYCPHGYLMVTFYETLNPSQKIEFRKHYLRKVSSSGGTKVVMLQDIKDLVLYLAKSPMTRRFINFFHLPLIDRYLRSLIVYFEYYIDVWDEIIEKRSATTRKAPNPLAGGAGRLRRAEEMRILRCVVGREYSELLLISCSSDDDDDRAAAPIMYNRKMANGSSSSILPAAAPPPSNIKSRSESELGIFEFLIVMAHRIVWIALGRKYYNLIEVEMHRLFRTDAYNMADRRRSEVLVNRQQMLDDELRILHGSSRGITNKRKLLLNSPLPFQIIHQECDFRILSLGIIAAESKDPRIIYLKSALLAPEEKLAELGIKVGILGHSRDDYDTMLVRLDSEESVVQEPEAGEKEKWEKRKSSLAERMFRNLQSADRTGTRMPSYGSNPETLNVFPMERIDTTRYRGKHDGDVVESARRKWIARELRRIRNKSSIATTLE